MSGAWHTSKTENPDGSRDYHAEDWRGERMVTVHVPNAVRLRDSDGPFMQAELGPRERVLPRGIAWWVRLRRMHRGLTEHGRADDYSRGYRDAIEAILSWAESVADSSIRKEGRGELLEAWLRASLPPAEAERDTQS